MQTIVYVVSRLSNSGPTNQLFNLIANLNRERFSPILLVLSKTRHHEIDMTKKFQTLNVKVLVFEQQGRTRYFSVRREIRKLVGDSDLGIVHSQGLRPALVASIAVPKDKHIHTVRNNPEIDYPNHYGQVKGHLLAATHWLLMRKTRTVACSHYVQTTLAKKGVHSECIQNGVDVEKFHKPSRQERKKAREELDLPLDVLIFVSVSTLTERKNFFRHLSAFRQLLQSPHTPDGIIHLVVGGGPLEQELRTVHQSKNVIFLGEQMSAVKALHASDAFVSASIGEGLPNAVLEAQSSGLPLILSDIPPHREIAGDDAEVFDPYSVQSIENAFRRFVYKSDNRRTTHQELSGDSSTRFSSATNAKKYEELYNASQ